MSRTQEELAVSFLFLIDGRKHEEWLPALLTAVGINNKWSLWCALNAELKLVPVLNVNSDEVHDHLDVTDELTSASEDDIYNRLCGLQFSDSIFESSSYTVEGLIDELRDEGLVFGKWFAERGTDVPRRWHAEGAW